MRPNHLKRCRRPAFTLVELLVVISLIVILAALTVAFLPSQERQRVPRGASDLQGWLLIAKNRALRDQVPVGIRFQPGRTDPLHVSEMQYIEQPEPFSKGRISVTGNLVTGINVDFRGGFTDPALWPVQPGDYLEVKGGGLVHRIAAVPGPTTLQLATAPLYNTPVPTQDYRILRAPRLVSGEAPLQLPQGVIIDLATNTQFGNPLPIDPVTRSVDVLFAPSGTVIGPAAAADKVIFWVRDATRDAGSPGEPILIIVYTRTGFVTAHPADLTSGDPYSFTRDGRSSE
jgi:prepilin-type N-terminal cleavage/methylation domain-containing protein